MCRCGEEEVGNPQDFPLETSKKDVSAHTTPQGPVSCELCDAEASIYCQADDAFLCRKCDIKVHSANFLAQRHIRCQLCSTCQSLTHRYLVGVSVEVVLPTIVSKKGRNHCYTDVEGKYTEELKRPILLL